MTVSLADVVREQERRSFLRWLRAASPEFDWSPGHLSMLRGVLERTASAPSNVVVEMPVRHGKSELGTVRFPVWRLERDPATRVVVASYNATTAERFGRKARRLAEARGLALASDRRSVMEWETEAGGTFRSVGVGGGVTGYGFDVLIVDDPIKGREDADSPTVREKTWDWFTDDLLTRREPGASVLVVMSRWHEDDLVGRIFERMPGIFERVTLPALAVPGDSLERAEGEALWPARFDESDLAAIRLAVGERAFGALYQQSPSPASGVMFDPSKIGVVDVLPAAVPRCRAWDLASSVGSGDYTAGVLIVGPDADGAYYVADVQRGRWGSLERDRTMLATARSDGPRTKVRVPQDPGAAGKSLAEHHVRMLAGFSVEACVQTGSKETRADPFASQVNAGNVRILRGGWNAAFLDELGRFPFGSHDDAVDAASLAFEALASPTWPDYLVRIL